MINLEELQAMDTPDLEVLLRQLRSERRAMNKKVNAIRRITRERQLATVEEDTGIREDDHIQWICVGQTHWQDGIVIKAAVVRGEIVYTCRFLTVDGKETGRIVGVPPNAIIRKVGAEGK